MENDQKQVNDADLTVLNEINKGAKMGMDSISHISKKVSDENFKEELTTQYAEYGKIVDSVNTQFEKYGRIPDENNVTTKMMGMTGIELNTMTDKSNSHIAEMLIQGEDMAIIKCQKLLNNYPQLNPNVKGILNNFITTQENVKTKMKSYL